MGKEQLQAESNIHAALAKLEATTDPDMKQIWQRVLNTRLVGKGAAAGQAQGAGEASRRCVLACDESMHQ